MLADIPQTVRWLGLGPLENYPDRKLAAQQGRWALPLDAMQTPYIFPTENGLRCDTRELTFGSHHFQGQFHFSLSRYSQQQLHTTTHQHLLREEAGCWLNLDAFHMGVGGRLMEPERSSRLHSAKPSAALHVLLAAERLSRYVRPLPWPHVTPRNGFIS